MASQGAKDAVAFFTKDSSATNISPSVVDSLESQSNQAFMQRVAEMMSYVGNDVRPFENEKMGSFFTRLNELAHNKFINEQRLNKAA
jgi:hypothetical protein